jgi:DNA polymerase elongation subunit (family B)
MPRKRKGEVAVAEPDLNTIIYGADRTPRIVAVEAGENGVTIYRRTPDGLAAEADQLRPWLVAEQERDLPNAEWTALGGQGYAYLAEFPRWTDFARAVEGLRTDGVEYLAFADSVRQYLVRSGRTLFEGMDPSDVNRLQLDIETSTLSPQSPEARIILIAVGHRDGVEIIEGAEREMLLALGDAIRQHDPDVIEGHNIFGFDLPYLAARAEALRVSLEWGRDGSALRFGRRRRATIGGRTRPFVPAYVRGRHIIDTMLAVQRFDAQAAELESYSLKDASQQLGIAEPGRILLNQADMVREYAADAERFREYARQDIRETRRLAEYVMDTDFYLTQMVPDSYQNVAVSGTGEKINALLVREYLRQGVGLSRPQPARPFPGGYVEVRRVGVVSPVVKVDVESLYPSIMLTEGIAPASDTLGIFLPMLAELTKRRFEAKATARSAGGPEQVRWEGIQSSFKVLINSFYGYLGSGFLFNDFAAAERVTKRGQQLIKQIADRVEETGGEVIEIDTDGVYFRPPEEVRDEQAELSYVEELGSPLPKGIKLAHDGRYRAMVSLKQKNYACIGYDGRKVLRGAALRSRADEPFGREFLLEAIDLLLAGDLPCLAQRYGEVQAGILGGELPIERLARKERVTEKTLSSPAKKRAAAVVGETPVGDYMTLYQRTDGALARLEDYAGDEDRAYYADKLYKFALRLADAIGPDFDRLFPPPSLARARQESAGQRSLGFE